MRASTQITSGSLFLFAAEELLSRCDVLWDSILLVPGEFASVLVSEPLCHFGPWPFFLFQPRAPDKSSRELGVPLELQQGSPF